MAWTSLLIVFAGPLSAYTHLDYLQQAQTRKHSAGKKMTMNRTRTLKNAVRVVSYWTWLQPSDVELAARDLISHDRLPKSVGRNFAQYDSRGLGQIVLACLVAEEPTNAMDALSRYENLRSLSAQNQEAVEINRHALAERGLTLDTSPIEGIATLGTLFKKNYLEDAELSSQICSATVVIDRSHQCAFIEWPNSKTATVFGSFAASKRGEFVSCDVNPMPVEVRWQLKWLVQSQLEFFSDEGDVGYTGR